MKMISLGQTGLQVSTLCMGTVYFGSRISEKDSFAALDHFVELGGNFLDTARIYADWLPLAKRQASEKCLGRWVKARGYQERVVVATKGGHPHVGCSKPTLNAASLTRQADESRRNLGLETLPLYYLHRDDRTLPVEQIMDALFALQDWGAVRHIACSNWTAERIIQANAYARSCGRAGFVAASNQWSLAKCVPGSGDPTLVHTDDALIRLHAKTQLPLLPFTSMAQGYLSKLAAEKPISGGLRASYGLAENDVLARRAKVLADRRSMSVAQVAQCYFYAQPFPVVPVMSFSSFAQMEEAAAATEMTLSPQELAFLTDGVL